jgi:hypothetical protein
LLEIKIKATFKKLKKDQEKHLLEAKIMKKNLKISQKKEKIYHKINSI